jgi:hypothetical protein
MELYKSTFNAFLDYLNKHGYPESSLAIEYPVGKYRVDLAVIDPATKEPMAFFEIKGKKDEQAINFGRQQMKTILKAASNKSIPAYLVFAHQGNSQFEIQKIDIDFKDSINKINGEPILSDLIDFNVLRSSRYNSMVAEKKSDKEVMSISIWVLSWILALLLIALLIMDFVSYIEVKLNHLFLIAGVVALLILPFIKRLRVADFEIEMLESKFKKNKQKENS